MSNKQCQVCGFVVVQWNKRRVTDRIRMDMGMLHEKHVEHLTMLTAMKAFRKVTGASRAKPSKESGRTAKSKKPQAKASSSGDAVGPVAAADPKGKAKQTRRQRRKVMSDSASSTSRSTSRDTGEEEKSENSQATWDGKGFGSALGKPEASQASVAKGATPGLRVGPGEQIVEYWGGSRFAFSRIKPKGVLKGYGAYCMRHVHSDGYAAKTPCKKAISLGEPPMTEDEARLRLKRWIMAGSVHHLEPETRQRQAHIDMGGKHLRDFASDGTWGDWTNEDLDAMLEALD